MGSLTGGGHGYLTATYGMRADNLLEATIMTSNGTLMTINPCQNPDLFFATRGGGGSTFSVVISAIVRAFPSPQTTRHKLTVACLTSNASEEFWNIMGYIHSEMPALKAGGMQGYYGIVGPPMAPALTFLWDFFLYDKPNGTAETLIRPIANRLKNKSSLFLFNQNSVAYPTYLDAFIANSGNEAVGSSVGAYGSRLLSPRSISDPDKVAATLKKIGPNFDPGIPNVKI